MAVLDIPEEVTVVPSVALLIGAHAAAHPYTTIHGILVGKTGAGGSSSNNAKIDIVDAVPVCHESPTRPLVETALSLTASKLEESKSDHRIVGWYTAPEILNDDDDDATTAANKPGPTALRVVAQLAAGSGGGGGAGPPPVLVVVNNAALVKLTVDDDANEKEQSSSSSLTSSPTFLQAYGKDFGGQWMEPITNMKLVGGTNEKVAQALGKVIAAADGNSSSNNNVVKDLVDHWEAGASSEWTCAKDLQKYLS